MELLWVAQSFDRLRCQQVAPAGSSGRRTAFRETDKPSSAAIILAAAKESGVCSSKHVPRLSVALSLVDWRLQRSFYGRAGARCVTRSRASGSGSVTGVGDVAHSRPFFLCSASRCGLKYHTWGPTDTTNRPVVLLHGPCRCFLAPHGKLREERLSMCRNQYLISINRLSSAPRVASGGSYVDY